jgi:FdhD protein
MRERARTVEEAPCWLDVHGIRVAAWTATPVGLEALALGRLLSGGFIGTASDVQSLVIVRDEPVGTIGFRATVADPAPGLATRRHVAEHGCGALGLIECLHLISPPLERAHPPARVEALLRNLYERESEQRGERGGMHAAGIVRDDALHVVAADVSRHSAVDRALGMALQQGITLVGAGLVTTARVSAEIAAKAAVARLGWIASRSVPTTLAVRVAEAAGLTILARAGSAGAELHPA